MRMFAQALDLKDDPELIEEYIQYHKHAWPEVIAGLKKVGIQNMKIWRTGVRLFMVFEAPDEFDPTRDYQAYTSDPKCREWDECMRQYQRRVPAAKEGEWWCAMELVFELS